jgi:hypothetical protein
VEGERERLRRRAAQPGRDAVAELARRLPAERQDEDAGRVEPAPLDPLRHRLDDRGRLAGAWARQHEQRAAAVVDHAPLCRVQARRHGADRAVCGAPNEPVITHQD